MDWIWMVVGLVLIAVAAVLLRIALTRLGFYRWACGGDPEWPPAPPHSSFTLPTNWRPTPGKEHRDHD